MKARELIEILKTLDGDLMVCVDGYEGGVTELQKDSIEVQEITLNVHTEYYYGEHEIALYKVPDGKAIILGR